MAQMACGPSGVARNVNWGRLASLPPFFPSPFVPPLPFPFLFTLSFSFFPFLPPILLSVPLPLEVRPLKIQLGCLGERCELPSEV